MQYDTIEELTLELALYPNKKIDILEDCAGKCNYGWFAVAKDGNCALFDNNGDLDDINKVKSIERGMVTKDIEKIIIPDSVTIIYHGSFERCKKLTSVVMPDKLQKICESAFEYCEKLEDLHIPDNVFFIEGNAFYRCKSLEKIIIPDSVLYIQYEAFACCENVKEIYVGDNVKSIGLNAFSWCSNLSKITFGKNVETIGKSALCGDSNLKEVIFKGKTIEEVKEMRPYLWDSQFEWNSGLRKIRCEG